MNRLDGERNTVIEIAASDITPGSFAFEGTLFKFYSGADVIPAGAKVAPYVRGVGVYLDKANASDTFAVGADVFGDESAQNALTVGGDGKAGICGEASANGDLQVLVLLNAT